MSPAEALAHLLEPRPAPPKGPARLDILTAPELGTTIDRVVEERRPSVTADLSGLDLIDSSGVAALVALYKRVRANGGQMRVVGARDQPLAIFKLLRMDKVFLL